MKTKAIATALVLANLVRPAEAGEAFTAQWICQTCKGRYVLGPTFPERTSCEKFLAQLEQRSAQPLIDAKCIGARRQ